MPAAKEGPTAEHHRRNTRIAWHALGHPLALTALGVLVVNDWLAKPSAGFRALGAGAGAVIVGKASDVAGLVLAPLVVAVGLTTLAAWGARRSWFASSARAASLASAATSTTQWWRWAALGLVAVPFCAAKLSPLVASALAQCWTLLGRRAYIVPDASDILVVPFLLVPWWLWRHVAQT